MRSLYQELEEKGYAVIDFLSKDEVQGLINFYQKTPFPEDSVSHDLYLSTISSKLSYRQLVNQEIKKSFTQKLEVFFPEYKIVSCAFSSKKSNASYVPLHQDPSLVDETFLKSFIIWCPLVDVNEENGCLQVVKKSHLINSKPRHFFVFPYNQDIRLLMQQNYLTSVPMKAGQALVFDRRSFHGSFPNSTVHERLVAVCSIVTRNSPIHCCYKESPNSNKLEIFEVEDDFYDNYVQGQKPQSYKSLRVCDYEVDPLTPEQLVEFMSEPQPKVDKGTGIRERFLSFFNLLRGSDWWFYKIPPLLAIAYAEILLQATPPQQSIATLLTLLASMFFVAAYGHVINDIFDVEVDLLAGKPNRMASLSTSQRLLLCVTLAGLGLVPWLFISFSTQLAILLAAIYILLTIYSAPPLRLKERDIWGVITDAAQVHAVPTLLVATVFSYLADTPQPESAVLATVATAWAFLAGIRSILLHQIWDRESDLSAGVTTLVTRIGVYSARFGIVYISFPIELLLLSLLILIISQFVPSLLVFCALYILLRIINTQSALTALDPAPAQKTYILPHDFYEVWLPLALLILLAIREPLFLSLLVIHIGLFYPAIAQRVSEFNPLLISGSKVVANLLKLLRSGLNRQKNLQQQQEEVIEISTVFPSDKLRDSITKAIDFLAQAQLDDGEFKTTLPDENLKAICETLGFKQEATEKLVFDSSPFVTSLVVYSLSFISHESKVQQLIKRGLGFLSQEMESGGLWRYWSSKNEKHNAAPPDLDDVCCASYVLKMNGIPIQPNTAIILDNRNQQGLFYTWLLPISIRGIVLNLLTLGKRFSYLEKFWETTDKDDICCVVNANVLLYLGENRQTQRVIEYLISIVLKETENKHTSFYNHKLSFYYMLSRAYFNGANSLGVIKIPVINKILSLQKADGSFGDELLTALAVCALLNFNSQPLSLDKAINFLLKTQQCDGSWQRIPMYGGKTNKETFGSAELTTAFCVEALARYRLLDMAGNIQQSQKDREQLQTQLQQTEQNLTQSQSQLSISQIELTQVKSDLQQTQKQFEQTQDQLQQTEKELTQSQSQLYTTQSELIQSQSEIQTFQTELAQLKSYLQQTQGGEGLISYYRSRIASNPDDIQLYHQALTIKPDDVQIHWQLGNALVRQNRFDDAQASYQTALQYHPNNFEIHLELGKVLEKEKKWDEAINSYRRAIELNPDDSRSHKYLGDILAECGQINEASVSYRRALQLQPRIF